MPQLLFPQCQIVWARRDLNPTFAQLLDHALASQRTILVVPRLTDDTYSIFATEANVSETDGKIGLLGLRRVRILHTDMQAQPPACDFVPMTDTPLTVTDDLIRRFRSAFGDWLKGHPEASWAESAMTSDDAALMADLACQVLFGSDPQRASLLGIDDVGSRLLHCLDQLQIPQVAGANVPRSDVALPKYSDVGDRDREKAELRDVVQFALQPPEAARRLRLKKGGAILWGPPGTGKSYLAAATAGEFGCRFLTLKGQRGVQASAVEDLLRAAAAEAPVVVLIEGLDLVDADDWIVGLDRASHTDGLALIGTAPALNAIDASLLVPGRFDHPIAVGRLDGMAIRQILEVHLRGRANLEELDLGNAIECSKDRSAAHLERLVNLAAMSAFKAGRGAIAQTDLDAALDSTASRKSTDPSGKTWDDLVLPDATISALHVLQTLIEDPRRGQALGVKAPRGAVLFGPPGTGKTTVAKVLAEQTRCSFFPISVADILDKWVGVAEQRVRRLFQEAREHRPSIVFIDELDALAGRRSDQADGNRFMGILLNQLLTEIDGFEPLEGVFVIGATNRIDMLDPAMIRGGRLSEHIEIGLPDRGGRLRLIQLYTATLPLAEDIDIERLADAIDGLSGGDIESMCQRAARLALGRNADCVEGQDFEAALPPSAPISSPIGFRVSKVR
ncbi:MAG TPA: AAA family ATPase [Candidatus Dormibacteraeota bacterium]|nr:AAA family ATPase [Candidatus Dormibacteraeota bacterium]